ncbi:MAG: FHA domain-containing protein [Gemmatimonadaceae bacterium]
MPFIDYAGNTRELPPGETLVGSGPQARWRLQNDGLAPRHFTLAVHAGGRVTVQPHSARTVVAINGERAPLGPTTLAHGDVLRAGRASLCYLEHLADAGPPPAARAGGPPAHLVDEAAGEAFPLDRPLVRIGRGAGSDVPVRDPAVSRTHAEVRAEAGELVLHPVGSTGTRVNERRTGVTVLEEGDVIEVGERRLRFTRAPLAPGLNVRRGAPAPADERSVRPTTSVRLVTLRGGRAPHPWWVVAALLGLAVFTAAFAWLLLQ